MAWFFITRTSVAIAINTQAWVSRAIYGSMAFLNWVMTLWRWLSTPIWRNSLNLFYLNLTWDKNLPLYLKDIWPSYKMITEFYFHLCTAEVSLIVVSKKNIISSRACDVKTTRFGGYKRCYLWASKDTFANNQHRGLNQMANILQTAFFKCIFFMNIIVFSSSFQWSLFLRLQLTHCVLVTPYGDIGLSQHWFR